MPAEDRKREDIARLEEMLRDLDRDLQILKDEDEQRLLMLQGCPRDVRLVLEAGTTGPLEGTLMPRTAGGSVPLPQRLEDFSSMDPVSKRACIRRGLALPDEHLRSILSWCVDVNPGPDRTPEEPSQISVADDDANRSTCSV